MSACVFISYRREDSATEAKEICTALTSHSDAESVFLDARRITPGSEWPAEIRAAHADADTVLVVVKDWTKWLGVDEYGLERRIDDPEDWVRQEVLLAIEQGKRIFFVLVGTDKMISVEALPDDLKPVTRKQSIVLREDHDIRKLVESVFSPTATPPPTIDLESLTKQLLSAHHIQVRQRWDGRWADAGGGDKPPFIETQELRLLLETAQPEKYLRPEYFRAGRGSRRDDAERDLGEWAGVDRGELARNGGTGADGTPCDLSRLVITTDAGVGKTIAMQWLEAELSRPGAATAAFYLTFSRLPKHVDELLPELARQLLQADGDGKTSSRDDAVKVLESLLREGHLVLLFDALDQAPADGSAAGVLNELLDDPVWRGCRIVVSGRPYALQRHWSEVFADELRRGWRFVQVDEFTPDQQRQFLGTDRRGQDRLDLIPRDAHEILSTPRVLSYLRDLSDAELKRIRAAGDVYWLSTQHMLIAGMQGSEAARRVGLGETEPTPAKVQARSILRAQKLLAAIAFEMSWTREAQSDAALDTTRSAGNFDGVPRNRFQRFRGGLLQRLSTDGGGDASGAQLDRDLDGLAALNDFIAQGFFDTGVEGLREIFWRNRSLQEFFAAYWLAQYGGETDSTLIADWLYLPDRLETEEYYWVWRFLSEMHLDARDPAPWLRAIEPIYRPGDGTVAGTRRSSELSYRAWRPLQQLVSEGEPAAVELQRRFLDEFAGEILSGRRGKKAAEGARQFCDSFLDVPAGEFRMGSPPEKQGIGEELRTRWKEYLEEEGEPEERAEQHIADWSFTPGKRGEEERQWELEWWTQIFRDKDLQRIEERFYPHDETPADPVQKVDAFRLSRCPTLNAWYRLFAPGHGEVESAYLAKYRASSRTPDSPVIYVSWYDAWAFALWAHWEGCSCCLPREYEWEYAAKADTPWDQNYWWGNELDADKCNAEQNVGHTTPPSSAHANPWGFEDILGNAWEWCDDWYREVYDPDAVDEGSNRVIRGGSWDLDAGSCRSASRDRLDPGNRGSYLGFRVARSPSGQ